MPLGDCADRSAYFLFTYGVSMVSNESVRCIDVSDNLARQTTEETIIDIFLKRNENDKFSERSQKSLSLKQQIMNYKAL